MARHVQRAIFHECGMTYTAPVLCAYCNIQYGTKAGFRENLPTHGICQECLIKLKRSLGMFVKEGEIEVDGFVFQAKVEGLMTDCDDGKVMAESPSGAMRSYQVYAPSCSFEATKVEIFALDCEEYVEVSGKLKDLIGEAFTEKYHEQIVESYR